MPNQPHRLLLAVALISALACSFKDCPASDIPFFLKNGDRVVFYGDSITEQRLYTTMVETYVVTRFPQQKIEFINSGWGGDRVTGGGGGPIKVRLQRDVYAHRPTVVTIMLGMNDASYRAFDDSIYATFTSGYSDIVNDILTNLPGVRLTLIQPSPFDDVTRPPMFPGGYNAVLVRYGNFVQKLAATKQQSQVDFNGPVVEMLKKAKELDPAKSQQIIPDRVHPGQSGHLIMAEALLRSWNAPAVVTEVDLGGGAAQAVNSEVRDLQNGKTLTWTQIDQALPMPVNVNDPVVKLTLRSSNFTEALNEEVLKVTDLKGSYYNLKIDDESVGIFTSAQLAAGINLAVLKTPMSEQAETVRKLIEKHTSIHALRWHSIEVGLEDAKTEALEVSIPPMLRGLDEEEAGLVAQAHSSAQPVPHHYVLAVSELPPPPDTSPSTP